MSDITPDALRKLADATRSQIVPVNDEVLYAAADRIEALTDERDEAVALLRDWHESGVAFSDSRLDYEERQVDVGTIAETRAFLSRQECVACEGQPDPVRGCPDCGRTEGRTR